MAQWNQLSEWMSIRVDAGLDRIEVIGHSCASEGGAPLPPVQL